MGKEIIITWPDQSNAILSHFISTGLHAACIHVKIDYLRTEMILMSVLDAHTAHHHQNVLQSPFDRSRDTNRVE